MSTSLRKQFGLKVKELRQAAGMSQEAFADRCGFARSYMSRVERGGANPSLDAVEVFATALGVKVKQLFDEASISTLASKTKPTSVLVPYAKDGTCFNPTLRRPIAKNYCVGSKGALITFDTFEEALEYLSNMPTAHWLRPNKNGAWGVVSAAHWGPLPTNLARNIEKP